MNVTRYLAASRRRAIAFAATASIRSGLVAAATVAALAAGTLTATSPADAATQKPAAVMSQVQRQQMIHRELNIVRAANPSMAKQSDTQIMTMLKDHAHVGEAPPSASGVIHPMVSGWGTGTLWFSRYDVAIYATLGTAAMLALLFAVGVGWTAEFIVGSVLTTFWGAYFSGYCAWITYRNPKSWGSYRC